MRTLSLAVFMVGLAVTPAPVIADQASETKIVADRFKSQRDRMVSEQIVKRGITDSLTIEALLEVPRHKFVPQHFQSHAYRDQPLPIGENQTISQPYIVALMTELLALSGDEKVLEIGTGSGYQAAILSKLVDKVYTIEIVPSLAARADSTLRDLGYANIEVRTGDGYIGWPEAAPFDRIIVTAAPPRIPQPLLDQLADSGRMVIPVGTDWQELVLIEKIGDKIKQTSVIPVRFVPFTGDSIRGR